MHVKRMKVWLKMRLPHGFEHRETLAGASSADAAPKDVEQVLGTASPFERPARLLLAEVESSEALPLTGAVLHPSAHASVPDAALGDAGVTLESGTIRQGAAQLVLSEPSATRLLRELAALRAKALPSTALRPPKATLARRLVAAALAEAARSQAVVVCQAAPGSLGALPAPSARRLAEAASTASPDTTARAVAWITGIALLLAVLGAVYAMLGAENRSDTSLFGVTKSHTQ
ncbi:hypothetical protein QBZ16_004986 [Prototheca wickerhamii]|uniref:Uncharacterized protein n=1 Tax=Prototheca wickerhamii TaxID=3111 RepID=A0AAD9IJT3_PROWI|nr:hypothetical protein QBZ16_004986 [Prototheca wickerhamii]